MKTNQTSIRNQLFKTRGLLVTAGLLAVMPLNLTEILTAAPESSLTADGNKLQKEYAELLQTYQTELEKVLPKVDDQKRSVLDQARGAVKAAEAEAKKAETGMNQIQGAKALVEHAKGKWIGSAQKGITQAEAALKKATTDAEREAATKDLAKWQANKEEGIKALKTREEALSKAQADEPALSQANQAAKSVLAEARKIEFEAANALLSTIASFLTSDQMDAKLTKASLLAGATPRGLAAFAQQSKEHRVLVDKLLADSTMIKQMLEAGGAKFGNYGQAMEIHTAIQRASSKSSEGTLQRLALATSLEHAKPIAQANAADQKSAPSTVDPVKRYLHYEKAYLDGELDPAFKNLTAWEMRMVVNCDAPDEILAWGREAIRNHRPDHIHHADYGWRYSAAVKTEVPYGSQNVVNDLPSLHKYQNIAMNGGICGRRAFFGRFILQSFGIPTWGVTQMAHAALSHWTPKGWVVNLGAGFERSWWDKDEASRSGSDFLLESRARARGPEYLKVLRAQWISRILGEKAYNDRKAEAGGFWSATAHDQAVAIAATADALGPLGQELGEANEPQETQKSEQAEVSAGEPKIAVSRDGVITIPAVAHGNATGPSLSMKSFAGGLQMHSSGGFKTDYELDAPSPGKYSLTVQVTTLQKGQKFLISANDPNAAIEIAVPYTLGKWKPTQPVEVTLTKGSNKLYFALQDGSRGVTIKEIVLTPVK
jgi:hypothetical protein